MTLSTPNNRLTTALVLCLIVLLLLAVVLHATAEKYQVICAWCGKIIGTTEDTNGNSHGICPECKEEQLKQIEKLKEK